MKPHQLEQVIALNVAEEQQKYVGTLEDILMNGSDVCHPHVIIANDEIIGLFLLDTEYSKKYDFCPAKSIGLRGFLISSKHQGKGFGKSSVLALKPYLEINYSQYNNIYLTVNFNNSAACRCYLRANFDDTNTHYLGGVAGPQHIMRLKIA
jgi:RimJ/RimL family protein N-acetyltransferase